MFNNYLNLFILVLTLKLVNTLIGCDFDKYVYGCDDEANTVCDNVTDVCICKPGYTVQLENGICIQSVSFGAQCMISQECTTTDNNTKCFTVDGFELRYNQFQNYGSRIWHSLKKLVEDRDRVFGVCKCRLSHQYDLNDRKCIYKVIGSTCNDHKQCSNLVENSECHTGVCRCQISHYHFNDSCLIAKNFQQLCSEDFECKSNLFCRQRYQCDCRKNYDFNEQNSECQYRFNNSLLNQFESTGNLWDHIVKVGGFVIIIVVMLFLCTKKETEQSSVSNNTSLRRRSTSRSRRSHRRSSSVNSHRPLTQTSSNASRISAYKTFEETRQTIIIPTPSEMVRTLSTSSDEHEYNPYLFDALFPQQSDNDDPPSYEEAIKEMDDH